MSGRGLLLALAFVLAVILLLWLTGDKSPLADAPADDRSEAPL